MNEINECVSPEIQLEETESSGLEVNYEGEYRAVTGVINILEQAGEDARAALLRSLRETVRETKRATELAKKYIHANGS